MAACKSLQHIFETPLPVEGPRLLEPLSTWNQLPQVKSSHKSSFSEIFGELHFIDDSPVTSSSSSLPLELKSVSSPSLLDSTLQPNIIETENEETNRASFSGSENKYDIEGLRFEDTSTTNVGNEDRENVSFTKKPCFMATTSSHFRGHRKTRSASLGGFPPPISCMSRSGKPWVCFKSYRNDGRFVLKEIRVPDQEFLHAYREGGRLKLQFIHREDEEIMSEVEREDDDDNDDDPEEDDGDVHSCAINEVNEANKGIYNKNEV